MCGPRLGAPRPPARGQPAQVLVWQPARRYCRRARRRAAAAAGLRSLRPAPATGARVYGRAWGRAVPRSRPRRVLAGAEAAGCGDRRCRRRFLPGRSPDARPRLPGGRERDGERRVAALVLARQADAHGRRAARLVLGQRRRQAQRRAHSRGLFLRPETFPVDRRL